MQISASPRIFVLAALPLLTKPDVVGNLLRHVKFFRGCWTFSEQITPRRAVLGRGARAVAVDLEIVLQRWNNHKLDWASFERAHSHDLTDSIPSTPFGFHHLVSIDSPWLQRRPRAKWKPSCLDERSRGSLPMENPLSFSIRGLLGWMLG
jgi:hypothetical protein